MAPNPQNLITDRAEPGENLDTAMTGDEVVISGISGAFPKSDNVMELMENLYNKIDMVEEVDFSNVKHPGLPKNYGKIKNLNKFDAQFFRVTHWQAVSLDPMSRKVMEHAFSAIYDSGINPLSLSGSKLGVFIGSSFADSVEMSLYESQQHRNHFIISGCSKTMIANRISYWIDSKGPSYVLDQACTGAMTCLEIAYNSIKNGNCDAALVGGCNVCFHPVLSLNLKIAGQLCTDGKNKSFDKNGDGYVRAEAINVLFLQKAKDAKRIYTEIYHIKGKYFTRPDANFLAIRKSEDLKQFLEEFYAEVKVSPSEVEYVEAFGLGIAEADGNELDAIGNFFAKSRPIKVGSIKSNMGNAEAANGTCSLTKLCLAYQKGKLPANLHYNEPQTQIPAIRDGRIQVVTKNTPFTRGLTALNSFSFTGNNYHVLLKGHYKHKDNNRYKSSIPRLVLLSGRDEKCVDKAIDELKSKPIDPEQIALLHNIYKMNFPGHTGRGYTILDTGEGNETISLERSFNIYSGTTRPVCFLYSGMGSQWNGMGTGLLRIPIFAAAIERCHKVLEPLGVDIVNILTDPEQSIFDNILNSMVGITAVQIGLTDLLKAIGIAPNHIIELIMTFPPIFKFKNVIHKGHSMGEVGCAYADGCFTAEETILSSYYRGMVSLQTPFIRGSMAAVGLSNSNVLPLCPPEIEVACHNSAESATISGPADIIKEFVSNLSKRGIFAREVAVSNIPYHSKYIANAGPGLLSSMEKLIPHPKLRSGKWISTSVPQEKWDEDDAKYASSTYFTNNLLNPVFFEENASLIPKDAIMIEIGPHGLLQAIVKKSHSECINVPLTKRANLDSVSFLLQSLGKLYECGLNPSIDVLYPKVEFPVSTETPLLSHLVEWDHSADWPQFLSVNETVKETSARDFIISTNDDEHTYMKGFVRNGINKVPETALLVFIWETLAMYRGKYYRDMSVTFYDVTFHCQLNIEVEDTLRLRVAIQDGSNRFEVFRGNTHIVSGFVKDFANKVRNEHLKDIISADDVLISGKDFYTLLRMKGYSYGDEFKIIQTLNTTRNIAYINWTGEWATFLDSLLQLKALGRDHDGVSSPKIITKLSIHVDHHRNEETTTFNDVECYRAELAECNTLIRCGGVELDGVIFTDQPRLDKLPDIFETREFVTHKLEESVTIETATSINLQIVTENVYSKKIKVFELLNSASKIISNMITEISVKFPSHNFVVNCVEDSYNIDKQAAIDVNLFVMHNSFGNAKFLNIIKQLMSEDAFILTIEDSITELNTNDFEVITSMPVDGGLFALLKKKVDDDIENVIYIPIVDDSRFLWVPQILRELSKSKRVVLVAEKQPYCGLYGVVKYIKTKGNNIGVVVVDDYHAAPFNSRHPIYNEQLRKKLTFNILKTGQWGSYYSVTNPKRIKIKNISLRSTAVGDLDNLTWMEIPKTNGNLVQVSYAGLSASDCQKALGKTTNQKSTFGMDFSGVDCKGNQIMGLVASGALSSWVDADSTLLWPVPHHWSLQEAATVPLPYIHAYYILTMKGQIRKNQAVFVTGGAGALGQAVISICHSLDCTVFTIVSDEKKKRFLMKLFPKLKDEDIAYSCHDWFFTQVKAVTKNRRCDIVINCSSGALREATMKCVGFSSTFIDVNSEDILTNKKFGMSYFAEAKGYKIVDLSTLFYPENIDDRKALQLLMAEGIANGTVRPLSRVVYSPMEVSRAFKLVSSSRHRGRALIKMCDSKSFSLDVNVIPRMIYSNGVHIVVCDASDLGVELIDHLIRKEAKNLIVHFGENKENSYLTAKLASWKKVDVTIEFNSDNLQTKEGCERLFEAGKKLGAVESIFIVQDYKEKIDENNIQPEVFNSSHNDTILVTANLDMVSRNMCWDLSHFVFISVSSQNISSEHAASACERICEARNKVGFPGFILRTHISNEDDPNKRDLLNTLDVSSVSSLFNALDSSLKLQYNNATVFNLKHIFTYSAAEKLGRIFGVKHIDEIDENLTLKELNANDMIIEEIKSKLSPVTYSTDELLEMTVACLKKLYYKLGEKKTTNFNDGLGAFYSHIERNEYVAIDSIIPMKTQQLSCEELGYIDRNENHLMMIPGFDGRYQVFESIAERLKIRVATLQLGPDLICDSIPEMAQRLANHIKLHFVKSSKFYILGFSFGVNIALEVAKLLEAEGRSGVVYCLDSSPDALKLQLKAYIGDLTEVQLQNAVLLHMFQLIVEQEGVEIKQELEKSENWSDKVDICMHKLRGLVHFSKEHQRTIFESAYKRILLANGYKPDFKLDSELVLLKGIPHPRVEGLSYDYSLSKYSKQPVKVFHIESDHASAPYDGRVSNIVNKMLDPNVLEEFKRKNLCEFYYC